MVGNTYGGDLVVVHFAVCHRHSHGFTHVIPNLDGVVLNPASLRENLLVLKLTHGDDRARLIEKNRAGTGGALVYRHNVLTLNIQSCRMQRSSHE